MTYEEGKAFCIILDQESVKGRKGKDTRKTRVVSQIEGVAQIKLVIFSIDSVSVADGDQVFSLDFVRQR